MSTKKFTCKIEEVPVIGEFIVNNAERDISDFNNYSPVFTIGYLAPIRAKIEVCKELIVLTAVTKVLKTVTQQLYDKSNSLKSKLKILEGYLKLGVNDLDISLKDIDIKGIKANITKRNIEGLLLNMKTTLNAVKRNLPVLEAQGLKQELIDEIETQLQEINSLNEKQNELTSKRNRMTDTNIEKFNELWRSLQPIIATAKVIYRDVDETKLNDYTIIQLKKIINAKK
ncbi:MAG: hypothetical protein LBC68_07880 [Prevotellaceae bacterium]|jgi:hypothetical protein|nr:hypothetical protein [Prevotellaceae bacterium]